MYNHLIKTDERNVVTAYVCVPYSVGGFTCIGQSESVVEMTVSEIRDGQALLLYKTMPASETEKTPVAVFDREGTQWGVYERDREEIEADYRPPERKMTTEERVDALEGTTDDIILMMAELIGGQA